MLIENLHCLYCDALIDKYSIKSIIYKVDPLCLKCRSKLVKKKTTIKRNNLSVTTFYQYQGFFKDLLISYKEINDEALKEVFQYDFVSYIKLHYYNYDLMLVPSSLSKLKGRGFNHLYEIFKEFDQKIVEIKMLEDINQKNKDKKERAKMLNNFKYNGTKGNKLLIIDDVITTGYTLKGVYEEMKKHYQKIKILSLSYVSSND